MNESRGEGQGAALALPPSQPLSGGGGEETGAGPKTPGFRHSQPFPGNLRNHSNL